MKIAAVMTLALVTLLNQAQAETGVGLDILTEGGKTLATLEHCGGTAVLGQAMINGLRTPVLRIKNVDSCSQVFDGDTKIAHIAGGKGDQDVVIPEVAGLNVHNITVMSGGKGKTRDIVRVQSFGEKVKPVKPARNLSPNIVAEFGLWSAIFG
ncbi:MAG: hypothetical protein H7061_13395, partial [Bdellovibrionaceae bacterium]|nr:hypothetical protein [Bdellovibrio sp.]